MSALSFFRDRLDCSPPGAASRNAFQLLCWKGRLYSKNNLLQLQNKIRQKLQNMYSRNIAELEDKLKLKEQKLGAMHPEVADSLAQLAYVYFVCERYGEAESLFWRAIMIRSQVFGQEDLSVAHLLSELARLYEFQEQFSEAERLYRLAYAIKSSQLSPCHHETLAAARSVVAICRLQGKHIPEAELERLIRVSIQSALVF